MINRRDFLQISLGAAAMTVPGLGRAQTFDTATIVVGFAPGGTVDTLGRRVAQSMTGKYAKSVVVESKTGAGGQIAIQTVMRAAPDGRTLLTTPMSMVGIYPHTYKKLSYDPEKDLSPVSLGCVFDFGLAVGPAVPDDVKTVPDFLEWCKANPGHANFGSPAAGSVPHFVGELIGQAGGVKLQQIPFRGTQPAIVDMMGGQVPSVCGPVGEFLPHLQTGKCRLLGTTGKERSRFTPDVPTLVEQGMKDMVYTEWFGFFMPANAPADVVQKANASLREALKSPEVVEGLALMGMVPEPSSPEELAARLKRDSEFWAPIIKEIGFTADS